MCLLEGTTIEKSECVLVVTGHNAVWIWNFKENKKWKVSQCEEQCILYPLSKLMHLYMFFFYIFGVQCTTTPCGCHSNLVQAEILWLSLAADFLVLVRETILFKIFYYFKQSEMTF